MRQIYEELTGAVQPVEIDQGRVERVPEGWRLSIPPVGEAYSNAQLDDYRDRRRRNYRHRPGLRLTLEAQFSREKGALAGTAGFGFWNAALGDPSLPYPALPQAVWFFFAAPPNDLPFGPIETGRGWFAATLDAGTGRALAWVPLAPLVILLCQQADWRRRLWPVVRRALGIRAMEIPTSMAEWHHYRLDWHSDRCLFWIDDQLLFLTPCSPRGPLGFVCWIDNQYMVVKPTGRMGWGVTTTAEEQWMEIRHLQITRIGV